MPGGSKHQKSTFSFSRSCTGYKLFIEVGSFLLFHHRMILILTEWDYSYRLVLSLSSKMILTDKTTFPGLSLS